MTFEEAKQQAIERPEWVLCHGARDPLGPAKQPTEGKVFGNVIEECLEAFFSACCQYVEYTQSQEYFAEFAENNEFEFYENGICIRHR